MQADTASTLVYCFSNMQLMHKPQTLATQANKPQTHQAPKQTYDVITEELGSDDDIEEWEVDTSTLDVNEVDDIVPILLSED